MFAPSLVGFLGLPCLFLACAELPESDSRQVAEKLWKAGQAAMQKGQPDEAIQFYQLSLNADPNNTGNYLSLAAAYLEKSDLPSACGHLGNYVQSHPEHHIVRVRYAELLLRLGKLNQARVEFEEFIADAQENDDPAASSILPSHSKLMEIAETQVDSYGQHLHRGIGLYLLACKRAKLPEPEGEFPAQSLFCKAAAELTLALRARRDEAQPCWYLYTIWSTLGQRQPALCQLRNAAAAATSSYLTPSERRGLFYAWHSVREGK